MTVPHVKELCEARIPSVELDVNPDQVNKHSKALLSLALAAMRLRSDVDYFLRKVLDINNGEVATTVTWKKHDLSQDNGASYMRSIGNEWFVRGVVHHLQVLLKPALEQYEQHLNPIVHKETCIISRDGPNMTIEDLLDFAKSKISLLETQIESLQRRGIFEDMKVRPGVEVPTSSPRQNLVRLVVQKQVFQRTVQLERIGNVLANISTHLNLPGKPVVKELKLPKDRTADGFPRMLFLCCRPSPVNGIYEMIAGASQEDWYDVPSIKVIRRGDRDYRLQDCVPLAKSAYEALRHIENTVDVNTVDVPAYLLKDKHRKYVKRRTAVNIMTTQPNPHFLNRTAEIGQAFDGDKEYQCCYACQGMIGYKSQKSWSAAAIREELVGFERQTEYPHSCAEVDACFQCNERWGPTE